MILTDYCIDALEILLDRDCVSERYYPLLSLFPILEQVIQCFI